MRYLVKSRVRFSLAILSLFALVFAACAPAATPTTAPSTGSQPAATSEPAGTTAPAPAETQAAAQPSGNIVEITGAFGNNMNHAPVMVGVEKGIFLKHGIDMKLKLFASGQEMNKMVQSGEAMFSGAAVSNFPTAIEQGYPGVVLIGEMGDATQTKFDDNLAIVARQDSGIQTLDDLAGKKVAAQAGSTGDQYLRLLLAKNNVDINSVNIQAVRVSDSLSALQGGGVDAAAVWEPYVEQILAKLPGSYVVQRGGNALGYAILVNSVKDQVEKNPEVMQNFVNAMAEATWYTRNNLEESAEIFNRWVPGLDQEIAEKAIKHMKFDSRLNDTVKATWNESVDILINQDKLKAPVPADDVFDMTFYEKTFKEHPEWFEDLPPVN